MNHRAIRQSGLHAHAFTLIEVIVTMIMLGVVVGLIAPRLLSTESRRAEANARSVAALVSLAAHRDALGSERLGIRYEAPDPEREAAPRLRLQVLRWLDDGSRLGVIEWRDDPFVPPVELRSVELDEALIEGQFPPADGWFLDFPIGEVRPAIELVLRERNAGVRARRWWIGLSPHETSAAFVRVQGGALDRGELEPVDLDALGLGDRPW